MSVSVDDSLGGGQIGQGNAKARIQQGFGKNSAAFDLKRRFGFGLGFKILQTR
jgi:hypothetical protein